MKPTALLLCIFLFGCVSSEPDPNDVPIVGCGDICVGSGNETPEPVVIQPVMCAGDGTGP